MKIKFLGTAAAEGVPSLFCSCETCTMARKKKKKNIRKRSSVIIDDKLLIDCGPDFLSSCNEHNIDSTKIETILITHVHFDHFYKENLEVRTDRYIDRPNQKIELFGNPSVFYKTHELGFSDQELNICRTLIFPYEKIELPDYIIYPILANHAHEFGMAYNYIIESRKSEKKFFILLIRDYIQLKQLIRLKQEMLIYILVI